MRDDADLAHVDVVAGREPIASGRRSSSTTASAAATTASRTWRWWRRRVRRARCAARRSHGHGQRVEQSQDLVAVGAAVDAVLVLHDRDVARRSAARPPGADWTRSPIDELRDDLGAGRGSGASTRRTTMPRPPSVRQIASRRDAVKVASPHWVGGKVLTNPNRVFTECTGLPIGQPMQRHGPHARAVHDRGQRVCRQPSEFRRRSAPTTAQPSMGRREVLTQSTPELG